MIEITQQLPEENEFIKRFSKLEDYQHFNYLLSSLTFTEDINEEKYKTFHVCIYIFENKYIFFIGIETEEIDLKDIVYYAHSLETLKFEILEEFLFYNVKEEIEKLENDTYFKEEIKKIKLIQKLKNF